MALREVKVKINGKVHNALFEWDESTSKGNVTLTFNAPEETSWHKEGHYYPIEIDLGATGGYMGDGEYLTNSYTDNDTDYGEKLRLVVKERVAPIIDLLQPLDNYYLTVRDNVIKFYLIDENKGSSINYESLKVVCANEDITDSVRAIRTDSGYFCKANIVDTTEGVYELKISVEDNDGNYVERVISYEYLVLVDDRSASDLSRYIELHQKELSQMTEEEKREWLSDLKGAYNYSDLNRVEKAVRYMSRRLKAYNLHPTTKIDWKMNDYFKQTDGERYIKNLSDIRNAFLLNAVDIPISMDSLTIEGANNIEKAIMQVDSKLNDIASQYLYSGEIYGGDI